MSDQEKVLADINKTLQTVIEPETGADVLRMRLISDVKVDENGCVSYQFRPSSPLCPLAFSLVMEIFNAIKSVEGVSEQRVTVVDYIGADELNKFLSSFTSNDT